MASLHLGFVLKLPLKGKEAYVTPTLITYFDFNVIYFKNDSPITLVRFRDYFSFAAIMFDYDIIVFFLNHLTISYLVVNISIKECKLRKECFHDQKTYFDLWLQ